MRTHRAATFLDVLIAVAVLLTLTAIVVTAVQKARDSSAHTTQVERLRRLGQGAQTHHDAHQHLPAGHLPPPNRAVPDRGPSLLPYVAFPGAPANPPSAAGGK